MSVPSPVRYVRTITVAKPSLFKKKQSETQTETAPPASLASAPAAPASAPPAPGAVVPFAALSADRALMAALDGVGEGSILPGDPPGAYVAFAHPMSPRYPAMAAAIPGLTTFTPVLICGSERPCKLVPFRAHLIDCWQYWAEVEPDGTITALSLAKPVGKSRLQDHVESVLLIHTPDGVRPARCRFKAGMTRAAVVMAATLQAAKSPDWARLSPAHAETLALPRPFQRCVFEITTGSKTSKTSGNQYGIADATPSASGRNDVRAMGEFFARPDGVEEFRRVWDSYISNRDELRAAANRS